MFVKMYWPTEALVGLWPLLNKGVYGMWTCDTCAHLFSGQADLTKFRGKKVNDGYSIAKPSLMGGDPGSSRVEVCSTGFYIILISIDYFSVLCCDLEIILYEAYLFVFYSQTTGKCRSCLLPSFGPQSCSLKMGG